MLRGLIGVGGGVIGGRGVVGGGGVVDSVVSHDRGGVVDGVNWGVMDSVSHGGMDGVSHDGSGVMDSVGGVVSDTVTGSSKMGEGSEGNVSLGGGESQGEEGGQAESLNIEKVQLLPSVTFLCCVG